MTATLSQRRRTEINAKLQSLDKELEHWKKITEEENRGLRRHHSQVRRLAATFKGLTESVSQSIQALPADAATVFANAKSWEDQILAAHSIWEVFRSKLVLREDELFRNYLAACDDLAWECYGPAMKRFEPDRKGPPLVYFTATWSPFTLSRDSNFQNEVRISWGTGGALSDEQFQTVLRRLPIPLVGVPWYQVFHPPSALIIAHEAGHIVEFDFDLTAEILSALDSAGLNHPDTWKGWASEVFADLYGCMCMGYAFVGALMDLLATSVSAIQTEERRRGKYPTRALRVELMLEALKGQLGHPGESDRLRSMWEGVYGRMQTMLDFKDDVKRVVRAVYKGPYRGIALTEITTFPQNAREILQTIGQAAADGFLDDLDHYKDPRELFAAAQWLHENPQPRQHAGAYKFIIEQIVKKGANQFRTRGEPVEDKAVLDADLKPQEETDRKNGRALSDYLLTLGAYPPPAAGPPDRQGS